MRGRLWELGMGMCVLISIVGCAQLLGTTITGSGNVISRQETVSGFDKLDLSHGFQVDVVQGEGFGVTIRFDDNLEQHLEVAKSGRTLRIALKTDRIYTLLDATLEATVTMPLLTGLQLSFGSRASVSGFQSGSTLSAELSGGSHLSGDIEAEDFRFDLSGGSGVTLAGAGKDLTLEASGGSQANLGDLAVGDASVDASGGSQVTVNASGRLDADASSGSGVYYVGSPTLGNVSESGGAWVRRK